MISRYLLGFLFIGVAFSLRHRQGLRDPPPSGAPLPEEQWFQQRLDHFKITEDRSWRQRYWINWRYHQQGGPVLLMIGGEGEANPAWMEAGSWVEYAKNEGAAMMLLEHRYTHLVYKVWSSSRQFTGSMARAILLQI